jgi:hypothetical protein
MSITNEDRYHLRLNPTQSRISRYFSETTQNSP